MRPAGRLLWEDVLLGKVRGRPFEDLVLYLKSAFSRRSSAGSRFSSLVNRDKLLLAPALALAPVAAVSVLARFAQFRRQDSLIES